MHFTAERGWINDPLAPTWDGERYHLYFQYVPDSTQWRPGCHWGHAVSTDLLHWHERPVALAPDADDEGVWSGSMVRRGDGHRIFYTAVDAAAPAVGRVRWADCDDLDAGRWVKGEVVVRAPEGLDITSFRDPFVYRDGDGWRMLVGASLGDREAAAASFSSTDLDTWRYDGLAASRATSQTEPVWTGSLWECPQLVDVGGQHALVTSVWEADVLHDVCAALGQLDGARFEPTSWQQLTVGGGYYAPATFRDADDEPCLVFWIRGLLDEDAGRAGALSVPHRLERRDDRLVLRLHPAVTAAASTERAGSNALLLEPDNLAETPVRVRTQGRTLVELSYRDDAVHLLVEDRRVSLTASPREVQVLLDGPVVEVLTTGGATAHTLARPVAWADDVDGATVRWLR